MDSTDAQVEVTYEKPLEMLSETKHYNSNDLVKELNKLRKEVNKLKR